MAIDFVDCQRLVGRKIRACLFGANALVPEYSQKETGGYFLGRIAVAATFYEQLRPSVVNPQNMFKSYLTGPALAGHR